MDLISLYLKLLQRKRGELTFNRDRLTKGLTKLVETREEVRSFARGLLHGD